MGLSKITRTVGKVGLALDVTRIAFIAGRALWRAIRGRGDGAGGRAVVPEPAPSPPE